MKKRIYTVLDLETTGLTAHKNGITEIAAVKFDGESIIDRYQTLIHPGRTIPLWIERLTGITNEMVENAPKISEIMKDFKLFLWEDPIVWHNVSFDFGFLNFYSYKITGEYLSNPTICTLKLARKLLPDLENKKLCTVCDYFWVINDQAHRAMSDTLATVEVFQHFWKEFPEEMEEIIETIIEQEE